MGLTYRTGKGRDRFASSGRLLGRDQGHLYVIIGNDGSGKSATLEEIRRLRPKWICTSIDPSDLQSIHEDALRFLWQKHPREVAIRLKPLSRSLYFMMVIAAAEEYTIRPALDNGRIVVVDSYYYRLMAKEIEFNPAGEAIFSAFVSSLTTPSLVFELIVRDSESYRRKDKLSPLEYRSTGSLTDYESTQRDLARTVTRLSAVATTMPINGEQPVTMVARDVTELIEQDIRSRRRLLVGT